MPQNWWDIYPEVLPSPAARQFPLPGPGGVVPGSGMGLAAALGLGPDPLSGAPRLGQTSDGGFDPSFLSGAPMLGQFAGGPPDQAPPIGYAQPPLAGDQTGPLPDRRLAVQQAAAAIRDGADPRAVRARLNQVGTDNSGFDPFNLFSDLLPGAGQAPGSQDGMAAGTQGPSDGLDPGYFSGGVDLGQPPVSDAGGVPATGSDVSVGQFYGALSPDAIAQARLAATGGGGMSSSLPQSGPFSRPLADGGTDFSPHQPVQMANQGPLDKGNASPLFKSGMSTQHHTQGPQSQQNDPGINGYGYVPPPGDRNLLQRFLYAELSTSNNWQDMPAAAWTAINRVRPNGHWPPYRTRDTIGTSLIDVLNKRGRNGTPQYSWLPSGGVGAPGGSIRWQESAHPERLTGNARQAWLWAGYVADRVLGGAMGDPTGGATHFYNRSAGTPDTIRGFFREATGGPHPSLAYSPYRSPNGQNFFLRTIEDPLRPVPWHPNPPPRR